MPDQEFRYIIVGGGMAGVSAIQGVRELDQDARLLLMGAENRLPYNRPPLCKELWLGRTTVERIMAERGEFWGMNQVHLEILGGDLGGVSYCRTLDDYLWLSHEAKHGRSVLVIGGGFIGSEMTAALHTNKLDVSMIFPGSALAERVFPPELAETVTQSYRKCGIELHDHDIPNMTGDDESYSYLPYFFSDLFDLGYEAVGEIDPSLDTVTDWEEPDKKGVIYYLAGDRVRGVLLCNIWGKLDAARELIRRGARAVEENLHGAIPV